ncbi:MAG: DUF4912 domain-containing protein [Candidatus Krumholzibacteriota bacterium]|nr:DUF4912 domain-containing protein [Candidatus Krumholzibacteriota bacterium]
MRPVDLKKMPKAGLLELARQKKIPVKTRMLKAELIQIIEKHLSAKKKPAAKVKAKTKSTSKTKSSAAAEKKTVKKKTLKKKAVKRKAVERPAGKPAAGKRPKGKPVSQPSSLDDDRTIRQKAVEEKYHLTTGPIAMPPVDSMKIPDRYEITRIVVMVRDPNWIFAYWEVAGERYRELERTYGKNWSRCRIILRVFDRTESRKNYFDIEPGYGTTSWYIRVSAGKRYQAAIGLLDPDGKFVEIAISNIAETPSDRISDIIDDKWLVPDDIYDRIFAASGGYERQEGSAELRALIEHRLIEEMGSEAVSSFSSAELQKFIKQRGFRLSVATELILYGATEPDARVTIQGKEIKTRPDGTFSMRFALPDCEIDIPVTAESSDGIEERTIETTVKKKSKHRTPVIR